MAQHKYITNTSSLFDDDSDEEEDDTFDDNYRPMVPPSQAKPSPSPYITELDRQRQIMLEKQKVIGQRTLDSSARGIMLLREANDIGLATANELALQGEQLENTKKRLEEMHANLSISQKHINGIKSVFHGFKNYLSSKLDHTSSKSQASSSSIASNAGNNSKIDDTLKSVSASGVDHFSSHPAARLRGLDQQMTVEPISDSQRIDKILDANLDVMVTHMSALKGLGMALGEEIEHQNNLIDEIYDKVDNADIKINHQKKEINKLLGK